MRGRGQGSAAQDCLAVGLMLGREQGGLVLAVMLNLECGSLKPMII